jgi:hypothetical protein
MMHIKTKYLEWFTFNLVCNSSGIFTCKASLIQIGLEENNKTNRSYNSQQSLSDRLKAYLAAVGTSIILKWEMKNL